MTTELDQVPPARAFSGAGAGAEDMECYGIVRVPVDYFHVGGFRYTVLSDAIAQAKRDQGAS